MRPNNFTRTTWMIITGLLMGGLFAFQSKSVTQANNNYNRESRSSIFKEIQIVKKSNQNLSEQLIDLEKQLASSTDREAALETLKKDISKYEAISGDKAISGPGVAITVQGDLEALWFVDMINELYAAGAEGVSVNGVRLAQTSLGFDTIPNGQILIAGDVLESPYVFEAVGDGKFMSDSINQSGGIVERILKANPEYLINIEVKAKLNLKPVNSSR